MKKDIFLALVVALALTFCSIQPALAGTTIIYVDIGANGSNDGTSWENAYPLLQMALDQANTQPGTVFEIWVARGLTILMIGRGTCKTAGMNPFASCITTCSFLVVSMAPNRPGKSVIGAPTLQL